MRNMPVRLTPRRRFQAGERELFQRRVLGSGETGVVHQRIDAAEALQRCTDAAAHGGLGGNVAAQEEGADFARRPAPFARVGVGYCNAVSARREHRGGALADAPRGAGDDDGFIGQAEHSIPRF
jgi:hypothetical protein